MRIFPLLKNVLPIVFLLFISSSKANEVHDLIYRLNCQIINEETQLIVQAEIKGNNEGKQFIRIPPNIQNVHFRAKEKCSAKPTARQFIYEITTAPNESILVDYSFSFKNKYRNISDPIIESDFFHFLAGMVLVTPELGEDMPKSIKIDASGLASEFTFLTSHSTKKVYDISQSVNDFRNSMMIGSKDGIQALNIMGQPVFIVTKGDWLYFKNNATSYLEKIITTQRNFWKDNDFPHYVITIIQQLTPDDEKYIFGTHKENVLTMSLPDGPEEKLPKVLWSLSHELFHAWLGMKIKIPLPQGDLQWFFEGVNDYYGLRLVLESGLISDLDYINIYNFLLKSYFISPLKYMTNQQAAKYFSIKSPQGQMQEVRAHLLFKEFSNKLQKYNKEKLLDDAMRDIFHQFGHKELNISQAKLDEIFINYLGKDDWNELKSYLMQGKVIQVSPALFSKNAFLIEKEYEAPVFDFDITALIQFRLIKSLDPKSVAFEAGLRNNQQVLDYFLDFESANGLAEILVKDASGEKAVRFISHKTTKKIIPQFKILNEKASA